MKTSIRSLLAGLVLTVAIAAPAAAASSKDDCKNGGYASWRPAAGAEPFTNQGQCVSFVARGGTLVSLAPSFACTTTATPSGPYLSVTASCTEASELYIAGGKDGGDLRYAVVNPDGTATISADFSCDKGPISVHAESADGIAADYDLQVC